MDYKKVGTIAEYPPGTMKTVSVGNKPIALANIDGSFFAIDDICTHEHCSLGTEGFLDDNIITCGCHGGQFDMTNGSVVALPPPSPVGTYEVKVEGDDIFVKA